MFWRRPRLFVLQIAFSGWLLVFSRLVPSSVVLKFSLKIRERSLIVPFLLCLILFRLFMLPLWVVTPLLKLLRKLTMESRSLNEFRFRELSQRPGVSDFVHALGLLPVEWGDAFFALKRFKADSLRLGFEDVPLTQREISEIIENKFFVQLELF